MTATMTTADAFLADIIREPDDDDIRLIFSDWLALHGQEDRATFIRLQCEIARSPMISDVCRAAPSPCHRCADCLRWGDVRRRERELWALVADAAMQLDEPLWGILPRWHVAGWSPNELHLVDLRAESHTELRTFVRRGFVDAVTLAAADWLRHGEALVRAAPIREVRLTTWPYYETDNLRGLFRLRVDSDGVGEWQSSDVVYDEVRPAEDAASAVRRILLELAWPRIRFRFTLPGATP